MMTGIMGTASGVRAVVRILRSRGVVVRMASTGQPAGPTPGRGTEQAPRAGEDVDIRTRSVLLQKGRPRPQAHSGAARHAEKQMPEDIKDRTVWQSWLNLKPRVRIAFGVGFAGESHSHAEELSSGHGG